ncbi:hypothetical protein AKO1_005338, partial [Acrasis kona]
GVRKAPYNVDTNIHQVKRRFIQLSRDKSIIRWGRRTILFSTNNLNEKMDKDLGKLLDRQVPVANIKQVLYGPTSLTWHKYLIQTTKTWRCVSIIVQCKTGTRTIDLQFESESETLAWYLGLLHLSTNRGQQDDTTKHVDINTKLSKYKWDKLKLQVSEKARKSGKTVSDVISDSLAELYGQPKPMPIFTRLRSTVLKHNPVISPTVNKKEALNSSTLPKQTTPTSPIASSPTLPKQSTPTTSPVPLLPVKLPRQSEKLKQSTPVKQTQPQTIGTPTITPTAIGQAKLVSPPSGVIQKTALSSEKQITQTLSRTSSTSQLSFSITLLTCPPLKRLGMMQLLRKFDPSLNMRSATQLVEKAPSVILRDLTKEQATDYQKQIQEYGCEAEIN